MYSLSLGPGYSSWLSDENRVLILQVKDLRIGQWKEPYIGLTQKNLIENSVQDLSTLYTEVPGPC